MAAGPGSEDPLSRWRVDSPKRSLPSSPRESEGGHLQHEGSSAPAEPSHGACAEADEPHAVTEAPIHPGSPPADSLQPSLAPEPTQAPEIQPGDSEGRESTSSPPADSPEPSLAPDPSQAHSTDPANTGARGNRPDDDSGDRDKQASPVNIPEPSVASMADDPVQMQGRGDAFSPASHDYNSTAASPEPFGTDGGTLRVTALGTPASAAWPPSFGLPAEGSLTSTGAPLAAPQLPPRKPSSAGSAGGSFTRDTRSPELAPDQSKGLRALVSASATPQSKPRGLSVKNLTPVGLEDPIVRLEQLPQLRNAPGLRRALSMAPGSAGAGGSPAVQSPPRMLHMPASGPSPVPHTLAHNQRTSGPAPVLAGGSQVHMASVRERVSIPQGQRRSSSTAVTPPPPAKSPLQGATTSSPAPTSRTSRTSHSNTGLQGTPRHHALLASGLHDVPSSSTFSNISGQPNKVASSNYVPEGYVPVGLEGRELHVPMHLVDQGQDSYTGQPGLAVDDSFHSLRNAAGDMQGPPGWKGLGVQQPPKLMGGMAMPFAERTHGSGPPARAVGKCLGGTVVKTAGRSGKAPPEATTVADAQHVPDQAPQVAPVPGALTDLICVRGVSSRDTEFHNRLPSKPRRKGPGRINFRALKPLPTAVNAGAAGMALDKTREGLARRMLAAEQTLYGPSVFQRKFEAPPATPEPILMDGFVLLEAGDDELPEGIVAARLSGRNIGKVESADLSYFIALRVLDLSDNRLATMALLTPLVSLQALSLSLNRMSSLGEWDSTVMFQSLVTLDLSYNQLSAEGVLGEDACLATLPALRELNLSGNALTSLPERLGPLPALELLKLADNRLTGAALAPLSTLPSLTSLNVSRNRTMQGLIVALEHLGQAGPEGYQATDVLMAAGLAPGASFPALHQLDLTNCNITDSFLVEPLRALPCLARLLLGGNPLATVAVQLARREMQKRAKAAMLAADGAILAPGALEPPVEDPLLVWQQAPAQASKPTVAGVLTGGGGRFLSVKEPMGRRDAERAAALAAVAAVPEEAVGAAFERVDATIEAWQLNTVPEGEEEEEEEDDGPIDEDMTFLTGVGITEKVSRTRPADDEDPQPVAPAPEPERPVWEDVDDPTERLALALGLDPRRLAVYTGRPTQDAMGAVNSLRFALSHPLVEANEGLGAAPAHLALTETARAKRRDRPIKLCPLDGTSAIQAPLDTRTVKIQTVEDMLSAMRSRLATLEGTLTAHLAAVPPSHLASVHTSTASPQPQASDALFSEAGSEDEEPLRPESPIRASSPFQTRIIHQLDADDDGASDMSPLPEDVMEAVENSDQGDPESEAEPEPEDSEREVQPETSAVEALANQPEMAVEPSSPANTRRLNSSRTQQSARRGAAAMQASTARVQRQQDVGATSIKRTANSPKAKQRAISATQKGQSFSDSRR